MFHRPGRGVDLWDQTPSRRIQEISLKARRNVSSRGPQPPAAGKDIPIFEHLWSFWKYSRKIPVAASEAAPEAASSVAFGRRAPAPNIYASRFVLIGPGGGCLYSYWFLSII